MAIFHLNAKIVSRGRGQSAVAKAAYNSHSLLNNENTGERHDYRYKGEVVFSGIFVPKSAPEWVHEIAQNREALWSAVEKAETRKNSQLAREIEIALPHELTDQQREYLIKDFVRENFVRHGMIADVAIHAPSSEGDQRNHHAHILLTMRHIGPEGFVEKMREYNGKAHLQEWREKWERLANRYLERFGHDAHIDHRTLEEQGVDREPTIHVGPTATDFERQGEKTERGDMNREIKDRNKERDELNAQSAQAQRDLEEIRKAYNAKCVEEIRAAWKNSPDGLDFMMELNNRGFCLAEDGQARYAAVDASGLAYSLNEKTYGYLVAPSMREAIEAVRRECPDLIIPTVEEYRQELRELREQRRSSGFAATLYNRAGMASMQRDAMRHLKEARRAQAFKTKAQARREHLQREQRERRETQEALRQELPDHRDTMEMWSTSRERVPEQRETRAADHTTATTAPAIHAKPQAKEIEAPARVQEAARQQETLRQAEEVARQRATLQQRQELAQQQEAQRLREELARQQEQKTKQREQQRQKEEREKQESERYQTKQAPREQQTQKADHKRATTEQTDAKQRRTHKDAMREIWDRKARAAQERGRNDYEREKERER